MIDIISKTNIYSVYDIKARTYGRLFLHNHHEEAIRSFRHGCQQDGSALKANPEDYNLHFLGVLNQTTGMIESVTPTPMHLASATDCVL